MNAVLYILMDAQSCVITTIMSCVATTIGKFQEESDMILSCHMFHFRNTILATTVWSMT